jgi:general secretion pathway protein J
MRRARARSPQGFTLVEMLVAIAIFGIMSAIGYRALDGALTSRDRVSDEYRRWRDVARAITQIERDVESIEARPVREASGVEAAPLIGVARAVRNDLPLVAFTRRGDLDADGRAGAPRRMGYRVTDGTLERLTWPVLDHAPRTTPFVAPLLAGVRQLSVQYRDSAGRWWPAWPPDGVPVADVPRGEGRPAAPQQSALPVAMDVVIELAPGQRIQRILTILPGVRS